MNDKALSTHVDSPEAKEIIQMTEHGLMPADVQQSLIVATSNLADMREVATPVGERHFNTIDTTLSVRHSSPISQARECLTQLDVAYNDVRNDFHKYRKIFLEVKLAKAKIKRMRRNMADLDEIDAEVMEAEIMLEMARIEELETQVNYGERELKTAIEKASTHAAQYQNILSTAGKESFSKEEFEAEELKYYAKSAWYHASVVFNVNEVTVQYDSTTYVPPIRKISMQDEVILYFEGLGITRNEVDQEFNDLARMRQDFDMAHGGNHVQSFEDHFTGWLGRMVDKYLPRIEKVAQAGGIERVQRIGKLIDPGDTTEIQSMGKKVSRRNVLR